MGLIIFLLVLSILVIVHEWGHYITAKNLGVRVEKFSVGFGPKLYSWMSDGTEFMICGIPLGGYVKMSGDERAKCKGRQEEFFSHPVWHRALIVVMGPVINIVFAYLCFYVVFVAGYPTPPETVAPKVGEVIKNYPAQTAGVRQNDLIVQIDDEEISSFEEMQKYISNSGGKVLNFKIMRGDQPVFLSITPKGDTAKDVEGVEEQTWMVGIAPKFEFSFTTYGPLESFWKAAVELKNITVLTLGALGQVASGEIPAKDALAGPIQIFDIIANAPRYGISYLVFIMAIISLNLAIFNLFPIPVLDGGHLFLLAIEGLRGKPLSLKIEEGLTKIGLSLILCLLVFVIYNDMSRLGWIESVKNFVDGFYK